MSLEYHTSVTFFSAISAIYACKVKSPVGIASCYSYAIQETKQEFLFNFSFTDLETYFICKERGKSYNVQNSAKFNEERVPPIWRSGLFQWPFPTPTLHATHPKLFGPIPRKYSYSVLPELLKANFFFASFAFSC